MLGGERHSSVEARGAERYGTSQPGAEGALAHSAHPAVDPQSLCFRDGPGCKIAWHTCPRQLGTTCSANRGLFQLVCCGVSTWPTMAVGHPPALHSSLQGTGRAEECSRSDRERGQPSSDKQSRGSREPFWHLSLLLSERSSLPDHRCLWPPVTRWRVREGSGHTDHAATHLPLRPASLASCPGGCPY